MKKFIFALCAAPVAAWAGTSSIDVGDSATSSGDGWSYSSGVFTVTGDVTVTGTTQTNRVVVAPPSGVTVNITLDSAEIQAAADNAFDMTGAAVNLTLTGASALQGGFSSSGLFVGNGSLTIDGEGSLAVAGGDGGGHGISISSGGAVEISGGTVTATGGIGGGDGISISSGGTVEISGGTVTATGRDGGYDISGTVIITGGSVEADEAKVPDPQNAAGDTLTRMEYTGPAGLEITITVANNSAGTYEYKFTVPDDGTAYLWLPDGAANDLALAKMIIENAAYITTQANAPDADKAKEYVEGVIAGLDLPDGVTCNVIGGA